MGVKNCEQLLEEYLELSGKLVVRLKDDAHHSQELICFEQATVNMRDTLIERRKSNDYMRDVYEDIRRFLVWFKSNWIKALGIGFVVYIILQVALICLTVGLSHVMERFFS